MRKWNVAQILSRDTDRLGLVIGFIFIASLTITTIVMVVISR